MDLIFSGLCVTLSGRPVLHDVSATLRPGRVTAILGPNGAGKSTLLKTAVALIAPAAGVVQLDATNIATLKPRRRARAIGYLPQDATLHWNVPAADVVALGRLPHRSPFAAPSPGDLDAITMAMAATDTTAFANRPVDRLSGGERARVLLARVLAGEPDWLLADEPLASLDPAHQIDMLDRLRDVAGAGRGVVLVLHDLAHAARVADDVLVLQHGSVAAFGSVADALTVDVIAHVFGIAARWLDVAGTRVLVPLGRA